MINRTESAGITLLRRNLMRRTVLAAVCLLSFCLAGCGRLVKIADYIGDESVTVLEEANPPVSLYCMLGGGQEKTVTDPETMLSVFNTLQRIRLKTGSVKKNLHIDDGGIGFIFTLRDGREIEYDFCTSEYYYDGSRYIKIDNPSVVRDACSTARNARDQ